MNLDEFLNDGAIVLSDNSLNRKVYEAACVKFKKSTVNSLFLEILKTAERNYEEKKIFFSKIKGVDMTEWSGAPDLIVQTHCRAGLYAIYNLFEREITGVMSSDLGSGDLNSAQSNAAEAAAKLKEKILFDLDYLKLDANYYYLLNHQESAVGVPDLELTRAMRLSMAEFIAENEIGNAGQDWRVDKIQLKSALEALNNQGQSIDWQSSEVVIPVIVAAVASYYLLEQVAEICGGKLSDLSNYFF